MRTNLIKAKELPKVAESSATDGMLDMVIAFDTTGSMSAYICSEDPCEGVGSQTIQL